MALHFQFFIIVSCLSLPMNAFADGNEIIDSNIRLDVDALKKLTQRVPDTMVRQQLASGLESLLSRYSQSECDAKARGPRRPATQSEIIQIENSMRSVKSSASKRTVLLLAAQDHVFMTHQVRQLMALITGDAHRLASLESLYFRVVDRKNFHTLLGLLSTSESQTQLLESIKAKTAAQGDGESEPR